MYDRATAAGEGGAAVAGRRPPLPVVGDVDHDPGMAARSGEDGDLHGEPGPHADAPGGDTLEAAEVHDLSEGREAGDVVDVVRVGGLVRRRAREVVGGRTDDDLQLGATSECDGLT